MPQINDLTHARAILTVDRPWSAYALGDLEPGFREHSEWWVAPGGAPALLLLYRGFGTPVLFAIGAARSVDDILDEVGGDLEIYLHIRPEILPLVETRSQQCQALAMRRMLLDPSAFLPRQVPGAVRIGSADLAALRCLYADGEATAEAPGFFLPSMLDQGVYFGVYEGSDLVAAAGTHLIVPSEGIAAVGNVYTRRDRRGCGLGGRVTEAVTAELLQRRLSTIVLNVSQRNAPACRVYERLGYRPYCEYYEGVARLLPRH